MTSRSVFHKKIHDPLLDHAVSLEDIYFQSNLFAGQMSNIQYENFQNFKNKREKTLFRKHKTNKSIKTKSPGKEYLYRGFWGNWSQQPGSNW